MAQVLFRGLFKYSVSVRDSTYLEYPFFGSCRVISWADRCGCHMQLAQPDGRSIWINRHAAMMAKNGGKAYRATVSSAVVNEK